MTNLPRQSWRDFHIISGKGDDCRGQAARLLQGQPALWVGQQALEGFRHLSPGELQACLGQEVPHLVFDALDDLDPDDLAIAAGLVRGGGRFLLLTPPLDCWGRQPKSRFLQRLARLGTRQAPAGKPPFKDIPEGLTSEQEQVIQALQHTARGHRNRPLVVIADRGRGKSTAFGMGAARLLAQGLDDILVTAPRLDAVRTLFDQAAAELPGADHHRGQLRLGQRHIRFMAPDELLDKKPDTRLLLVDEAAGIPLPMLEGLLAHYRRIAFSTTVHGYEGSGRGFSLRFARVLDNLSPRWKKLEMHQPVRWAPGDPLETFVFETLLLDAEPAATEDIDIATLEIETANRDELATDDRQLRQLFGLLVDAHYRTTPTDLKHLLDAPNLKIHLARTGNNIVGALLVATEGELPADLHAEVLAGRRRPKGQLLPTALAAHCGFPRALEMRWERILRIAVHPAFQGKGIGSRLLAWLAESATMNGVDMLGASFGATPALVNFWRRNGYVPARLGQRREASSSAHAAIMLRGISPAALALQSRAQARFRERFVVQLGEPFRLLDPGLAMSLLQGGEGATMERQIREGLAAFARGQRQYLDALADLHRLACLAPDAHPVLVLKILQGRSWRETAATLGLTGKKPVLKLLRDVVRRWLEA